MIVKDIFFSDVFIDITVEFRLKIPLKKRRRVLTEHNFKRVLAFPHGDVLVKCKWWMEIERICWRFDRTLFLFSLLSNIMTQKPRPKRKHFYHLNISLGSPNLTYDRLFLLTMFTDL